MYEKTKDLLKSLALELFKNSPVLSLQLKEILGDAKISVDKDNLKLRFSNMQQEEIFVLYLWELKTALSFYGLPLDLRIESITQNKSFCIPQWCLESEALKKCKIELRLNSMIHSSNLTDNIRTNLIVPNNYSDREKISWLMTSPIPAVIVWEEGSYTQTPFLANPAYGEFTSRDFTDWTGDEDNSKRWVTGELDRTLSLLDHDFELKDYSWKVHMFGSGDKLFRWYGNIQRIILNNKLARITQVFEKEELGGKMT